MQQQLQELTDLCTRLQRQQTEMASKIAAQDLEITSLKATIKLLEDKDGGGAEPSGEDVKIKGRSLETGEEARVEISTERGSNDTEELVNVLTSLDAANILTSGVQAVSVPPIVEVSTIGIPTGSGMVPTASPIFTTASVVTPYSRHKGKEKMVESDTPMKKKLQEQIDVQMAREMEEQLAREDQRMNEQIARDAKIARIHAEKELQMLIDGLDRNNETIAKYLQEYEQFAMDLSIGEKIDMINELVKYQDYYAKVLKYQSQQRKPLSKKQQREFYMSKQIEDFVPMASKEEGERFKRKGLRLEQSSAKKMKTAKDVSKQDLKQMMQLVPVEEVYVEALQHFDREDLTQLWTLVRETLSIRQATSDKEKELWVELKRLYEPDVEDQLWTHTQALMHDPKFSFQKGQFSHQWKFLIHTIMQCLSPKSAGFNEFSSNIATAMGEGSRTPIVPHHTPSPEAQQSSPIAPSSPPLPRVPTVTIHTVIPTKIPTLRQYSRRARIAQSLALPTAADEPTSTLPHDLTPRVTSLAADEGSMQHQLIELTDLCTRLQRQHTEMATKIAAQDLEIASLKARIKMLEDKDGGGAEPSGEDATIKGRSLETKEEAGVEKSTERGSNDIKELVNVLTSLDAASILTSRVQMISVPPTAEVATVSVLTGSGMVPTASLIFTTASVVTPYLRRKGKEKMVESDTPKKKKLQEHIDVQMAREMEEQLAREDQRMNEQIARDTEIARIHTEEELQRLTDGLDRNNETIAKYLQEYEQFAADLSIREKIDMINELVKYQDHYAKVLKYQAQQSKPLYKKQQREFYMSVLKSHSGWKTKHFKGMSLEDIREKFILVWKQIEDFVPMASKEEGERVKRKGLKLEQESFKKMKTSEEVSEEDLKAMMQLVPVEEIYVEALQVKQAIID
nr:hypothetical protein [Tanacetum cinerariifolium]